MDGPRGAWQRGDRTWLVSEARHPVFIIDRSARGEVAWFRQNLRGIKEVLVLKTDGRGGNEGSPFGARAEKRLLSPIQVLTVDFVQMVVNLS